MWVSIPQKAKNIKSMIMVQWHFLKPVLQFDSFLSKLEQRVVNLSLLSGLTEAKDLLHLAYLMISTSVSNGFSITFSFCFLFILLK